MIRCESAAVFIPVQFRQNFRERLQQLVSFGKAVSGIVEFHTDEIHIHQYRSSAFSQDSFLPAQCQLKEIAHAGKAGQEIILAGFHDAVSVEGVAQGLVQFKSLMTARFVINPLVGIPYMGKPYPGIRENMLPVGVDHPVIGTVFGFCPVQYLIPAALCRKPVRLIGDPRDVIRIRVFIHIMIHVIICLGTVLIAEQPEKSVRKGKRNHPFIQKLINGKRNAQVFQSFQGSRIIPVFLSGGHI